MATSLAGRRLPEKLRDALGGLAAMALGLAAFFVLIGWPTLIPTNIEWLNVGDRAMHTLGWMFFRAAPWGNPPGLSPNLGVELSNSIALVDGLPLFALPLKLVAGWLPQPFQYWGDWLLLCFVLQAVFAYAIAREMLAGRLVALCAAAFALITPAYIFRIEMHLALSGHWTILAGLYLYVRRVPPRLWMWPLLVGLTAGIHAYLLALVMGLWLVALIERLWAKRMGRSAALAELAIGFAAVLAVLWAAGFFVTGSIGTYGYGDYKLNLLWPLLTYKGWSQLVPDLPHTKYDYEGLSFLGIGILALLVLSLLTGAVAQLRTTVTRRWLPLAIMLALMTIFALSNNLSFGDIHLLTVPLPKSLENLASTFRSTGRFVWPLLYFVTIGAVIMLGRRLRALIAVSIIVAAFAAQAVDSSPALLNFSRRLPPVSDVWTTPLGSPFWNRAAAAGYTRIRVIPVQNPGVDWRPLGYFAVTHHLDIDSAYLGRTDERDLAALRAHEKSVLETGDFEPHTLYVLDAPAAAAAALHAGPGDLLAKIDERFVFARNGASLVDGLAIDPHLSMTN
jgi:hypothetical protein